SPRVDWTAKYLSVLPARTGAGIGGCVERALNVGVEAVGVFTGQPVTMLSDLYLLTRYNISINRTGPLMTKGSDPYAAAELAKQGVCADSVWPITLTYGADTYLTGVSDYNQQMLALSTKPSNAAYADAPNHRLLAYGSL